MRAVSIIVYPSSDSLAQCDSFTFTTRIGVPDRAVIWSTSDSNVVTVSPTNTAFAVGVGTATITATAHADTTKHDTAFVAVFPQTSYPLFIRSMTAQITGGAVDTTNVTGTISVAVQLSLAAATNRCLPPPSPASVQLALDSGGKDTVVAQESISLTTQQATLSVNTAARTASGAYVFPNGSYTLITRIVLQDGTLVSYLSHTLRLNNP